MLGAVLRSGWRVECVPGGEGGGAFRRNGNNRLKKNEAT